MMHDFAVTPRYAVFMDLPMLFLPGERPRLQFTPEVGARVGILPRHGTGDQVQWFAIAPCWVFHTLNAYEDGGEVVLLACRFAQYPAFLGFQPPMAPQATDRTASDTTDAVLYQWRLHLKTGNVHEGPLDDTPLELPRINEALTGHRSRFGYGGRAVGARFDGLLKYDLAQGTRVDHPYGQGRWGGEGVFVPRREPQGEDDGCLVTYVHDEATGTSEMVVVETRDFGAPPVARVLLPVRVPYGFHGTWIDGAALAQQR
jgi:carotenoid cleavage dioxygenase